MVPVVPVVVLWLAVPACPPIVELGTGAVFGAAGVTVPVVLPVCPTVPELVLVPEEPTCAKANGVHSASVAVSKSFFIRLLVSAQESFAPQ